MIKVIPIKPEETEPWLLKMHYAHRMCPISYAFGLYVDDELSGVVTYGVPSSSTLRQGVCGEEFKDLVLELNRLCCKNQKNYASMLVSRSLAMLPKPSIVISYADTKQGHVGYVYQATNWIYTGLSAKRTDWKIRGMEHLHGATIADMSRGKENRAAFMREKFGDDFYLEDRSRKHRYIYIAADKYKKKEIEKKIQYKSQPYPKGESKRYLITEKAVTQKLLF